MDYQRSQKLTFSTSCNVIGKILGSNNTWDRHWMPEKKKKKKKDELWIRGLDVVRKRNAIREREKIIRPCGNG